MMNISTFLQLPSLKNQILIPNRNFTCLDFGFAGCNLHLLKCRVSAGYNLNSPQQAQWTQTRPFNPRLEAISKIDQQKTSVSTIFSPKTLLESFTTRKSNNFKLLLQSCNVKGVATSSVVPRPFVGTRLRQKTDNFRVLVLSSNVKRR